MIHLVKVEATGGFFLLLAWMNYLDKSFLVPMVLLACTVHELGHLFAIQMLGGTVKLIRLTVIGAEIVLARPLGYWQEGLSALAGPGANLLLAFLFCELDRGVVFAGLNLILALFNLLPVGRLDGGRALFCTLALLAGPELARRVGLWLDWLCSAGLFVAGIILALRGNVTLLLAASWLLAAFWRANIPREKSKFCAKTK